MGLRDALKEEDERVKFADTLRELGPSPRAADLVRAAETVRRFGHDPVRFLELHDWAARRHHRRELAEQREKLLDEVNQHGAALLDLDRRKAALEEDPALLEAEDAIMTARVAETFARLDEINERDRALSEDGQQQGGG